MAKAPNPRISVNKLGEYILSKGNRQRQILRDQKYPSDFKGMYYKEAAEAVSVCLASSLEDTAVLNRTQQRLEQITPEKIGTQRRIDSNIDAIESFGAMLDDIDLMGASPKLGEHRPAKLRIQNVEISVRPEIILRGEGKSGKPLLGAVKVHYSRTFRLDEVSAGYVSAVVQEYCSSILANDEQVFGPYCFVVDIGSRTVFPGVRSITARMRDVEAECRNIAALWASISADE